LFSAPTDEPTERKKYSDRLLAPSMDVAVPEAPTAQPEGFTNILTGNPIGGYGLTDLAASKMTMGLSDKAAAGAQSLFGDQTYDDALAQRDADKAAYKEANPGKDWATLPVNLLGGAPVAGVAMSPVRAGASAGAVSGAVSGFGQSRGSAGEQAFDTALGGVAGAGFGALAGYLLPKATEYIGGLVTKGADKLRGKSVSEAEKILVNAMQQDGLSPAEAGAILDEARKRGVPMSLSDAGDNLRGLASSLSRKPGDARTLMRDAVISRQEGQTERIQSAISRDLGGTTNVREASDALIKSARNKSGPLFKKAFEEAPVTWTTEPGSTLGRLLATPAGKKALKNAVTIAQNEMDDPTVLGFNLNDQGDVILDGVPGMRTLHYVKRGLDDVVEESRDKTTGKLVFNTDNERATNNVRALFVSELKRVNPTYGDALKEYAGDAAMAEALRKGSRAINRSADDIAAETQAMTPAELEQYKLGVRSALANSLDSKVDGADKAKFLVGTPKKRKALAKLFGGEEGLDNLIATLGDEAATTATYNRINTGSPTAANLADDTNLEGLSNLLDVGLNVKGGRYLNAARLLFSGGKDATDKAAAITRAELADILTRTDPADLRELLRNAGVQNLRQTGVLTRRPYIGSAGGVGAGTILPGAMD
jgi:hypothetical protein